MAGEWIYISLQQVCKEIYRYPSFYGMEKYDNGVPVIRGEHLLSDGTISTDWSDYWFVSEEYAQRFPKTRLKMHDIVMSVRGSIGTFSKVGPSHVGAQISPNLIRISPNPDLIEPAFLYYALRGSAASQFIASTTSSSAVPAIRGADIKLAEIPLPPLPEQRAIAHILGTLDDKIELNRRMNETLEAIAHAIFKSWFVDFDPVRAKMDGRWKKGQNLPGLPNHLYDLFPERLVDSELGEIPKGWEVCSLGELVELAYGKALKEESRKPGTIPVYGSNGQVGWHDEALVNGPGIIVGRKGNPGTVTWVPSDFFAIDTTFYVVPMDKCRSLHFLFYALSQHNLPSLAADSAVPGLNRNFVYSNLQILPFPKVLEEFNRIVKSLFDSRYRNDLESRTLAALRDSLLPKLVSGEIRVKDAEKFLKYI